MNQYMLRSVSILVAAIFLAVLVHNYNGKQGRMASERFEDQTEDAGTSETEDVPELNEGEDSESGSASPSDPNGNEVYRAVSGENGGSAPNDCYPKDRLSADDLLPSDAANSKWAQVNPAGQGDVKDQNFLTAGYHVGVNTVGQTLRNANMQLRSDPPNPQVKVSPWNQTTIETDTNRRPMEIGGCE